MRFFLAGDIAIKPGTLLQLSPEVVKDIATAQLACANLEGPETTQTTPSPKAGPSVRQRLGTVANLSRLGFTYLALANNHSMDYGMRGLTDTKTRLRRSKIATSGAGRSLAEALRPAYVRVEGTSVAILSVAEQEFGGAGEDKAGYAPLFGARVDESVRQAARRADLVIVYAHGGLEECPFPPEHLRTRYREFIHAGATLVVGSHPHVPQGMERYQRGTILYSLGNLTIGFSDDRPGEWALAVTGDCVGGKLTNLTLKPLAQINGRIDYLNPSDGKACIAQLHELSLLTAGDEYHHYVTEQTRRLFAHRYQRFLQSIFPDVGITDRLLARLRGRTPTLALQPHQALLLKLMLINESHRAVLIEGLSTSTQPAHREPAGFRRLMAAVTDYRVCHEQ